MTMTRFTPRSLERCSGVNQQPRIPEHVAKYMKATKYTKAIGFCPTCGKVIKLKNDGTIRTHGRMISHFD